MREETQAFGEVEQAIHTLGVVVEHDQHRAGSVFRPRKQERVIGAEVEHRKTTKRGPKPPLGWQRRKPQSNRPPSMVFGQPDDGI